MSFYSWSCFFKTSCFKISGPAFFIESSDESIAEATSEEERDVQELTLDLEKKKIQHQSGSAGDNPDQHQADYEQNEDDTEDLIDNSPDVYTSQRATYASLLTQGHLYFRSWNELQTQVGTFIITSQVIPTYIIDIFQNRFFKCLTQWS